MSVEKRFRRCVDPCQRYLTLDHTRSMRYVFGKSTRRGSGPAAAEAVKRLSSRRSQMELALRGEHVRSVLEGMECVLCEPFSLGKALLLLVPFLERIGAIICPPRLGSSRC